jgi:hypothetical protein
MHDSETWVMTKKIENIINSYERIMEPGESDITKKYTPCMETQNYQQL